MALTRQQVREALIRVLASVEGYNPSDIEAAIEARGGDGNYDLDSKVAESVIAGLEVVLGVRLPGPSELKRSQYTSIDSLIRLVLPVLSAV
ncbi:MAG: hypothetical protein JWO18_2294 [Microbacteriaceae bacterium]|nr:hypothetical protein [Microbacteriaceae bacterium]